MTALPHKTWELAVPDLSNYRDEEKKPSYFFKTYEELYASLWAGIHEEWEHAVLDYEASPEDFYSAWHYLNEHPVFWQQELRDGVPLGHVSGIDNNRGIHHGIELSVMRDDDGTVVVWEVLETEWDDPGSGWHAWFLDGSAPTYEEAIVRAARKVWDYFGNDMTRRAPVEMGMEWLEDNGFIEREEDADGPAEDAREADVGQADGAVAPDPAG